MPATFEDTRSIDLRTIKILILKSKFQRVRKNYPGLYPKITFSNIKHQLNLPQID